MEGPALNHLGGVSTFKNQVPLRPTPTCLATGFSMFHLEDFNLISAHFYLSIPGSRQPFSLSGRLPRMAKRPIPELTVTLLDYQTISIRYRQMERRPFQCRDMWKRSSNLSQSILKCRRNSAKGFWARETHGPCAYTICCTRSICKACTESLLGLVLRLCCNNP